MQVPYFPGILVLYSFAYSKYKWGGGGVKEQYRHIIMEQIKLNKEKKEILKGENHKRMNKDVCLRGTWP